MVSDGATVPLAGDQRLGVGDRSRERGTGYLGAVVGGNSEELSLVDVVGYFDQADSLESRFSEQV